MFIIILSITSPEYQFQTNSIASVHIQDGYIWYFYVNHAAVFLILTAHKAQTMSSFSVEENGGSPID